MQIKLSDHFTYRKLLRFTPVSYTHLNDENTKRGIINIFLRAVYLFDETFTLILNGSDKPIVIDDILLDEIEEGLDDDLANHNSCSPLVADAPPI